MDHVGGAASGGSGTAAEPVDRVVDLAAVARDTATAFRRANVLIAGLKGLGTEIAKNLVLMGCRSVTLYDPEPASVADLGLNFYLKEADIGRPRADATLPSLRDLNGNVIINTVDALTEAVVGAASVVILTLAPRAEQLRWNAFCRTRGIAFMATDVRGAAGYLFNDFGAAPHIIRDPTGERLATGIVCGVEAAPGCSNGRTIRAMVDGGGVHSFCCVEWVVFSEVGGLTALNDGKPRRVVEATSHTVNVALNDDDKTNDFDPARYTPGGGMIQQVLVPVAVSFESLETRIKTPYPADDPTGMGCLLDPDLGKWGRAGQLHVAFQALHEFAAKHGGSMPCLRNADHATEVIGYAMAFNDTLKATAGAQPVEDVEEAVVRRVASLAAVELPGLGAFFGGIIAQEVVKLAGKFTPLRQWMYYDASEVLLPVEEEAALPVDEFAPLVSRYDNVIGLVGRTLHTKLTNQKMLLVGADGRGCELLKTFAMLGVGCGAEGRVTVADHDLVPASALSHRFLFRRHHVMTSKAAAAVAEATALNPAFRGAAAAVTVGADSEDALTDDLWEGLDVVVTAVTGKQSRLYVDARCCLFAKPMLDCGTLGTKGSTTVVKPRITETYRDAHDDGTDDSMVFAIPRDVVRSCPFLPEHCIEWARLLLDDAFGSGLRAAVALLTAPSKWLEEQRESEHYGFIGPEPLQRVIDAARAARAASYAACVVVAVQLFHRHFTCAVEEMLRLCPADAIDHRTGEHYWTGRRRLPVVARLDLAASLHRDFITHAIMLAARVYGVDLPVGWASDALLAPAVACALAPVAGATSSEAGSAGSASTGGAGATLASATEEEERLLLVIETEIAPALALATTAGRPAAISPISFDCGGGLDEDHVDFVVAATNLRAATFRIPASDWFAVRLGTGSPPPKLASTTAAVAGLTSLELLKAAADAPMDRIRSVNFNLGTNTLVFSEPPEVKRHRSHVDPRTGVHLNRAVPEGFTAWDFIDVTGNPCITAREVGDLLAGDPFSVHLTRIVAPGTGATAGDDCELYSASAADRDERGSKPLRDLVGEVCGGQRAVKPHQRFLVLRVVVRAQGRTDVRVDVPDLRIHLRA